ncbi:MAG: hypothetical protein C0412_15885 [Flavobacterium sp.]|nr:hypothetical protein [Flavobacterium sp.]
MDKTFFDSPHLIFRTNGLTSEYIETKNTMLPEKQFLFGKIFTEKNKIIGENIKNNDQQDKKQ